MELLGSIPTVWDTTRILDARLGDYVVTARKKGSEWYIGALNDSTARELVIPLGFLPEGRFQATICEDGANADRYPADYRISEAVLTSKSSLKLKLAPGGGFMARLRRQ